MAEATRSDVRDADAWWAALTDQRRVSLHRWQTGLGKMPPPSQPEVLFEMDPKPEEESEAVDGTG